MLACKCFRLTTEEKEDRTWDIWWQESAGKDKLARFCCWSDNGSVYSHYSQKTSLIEKFSESWSPVPLSQIKLLPVCRQSLFFVFSNALLQSYEPQCQCNLRVISLEVLSSAIKWAEVLNIREWTHVMYFLFLPATCYISVAFQFRPRALAFSCSRPAVTSRWNHDPESKLPTVEMAYYTGPMPLFVAMHWILPLCLRYKITFKTTLVSFHTSSKLSFFDTLCHVELCSWSYVFTSRDIHDFVRSSRKSIVRDHGTCWTEAGE